MFGLFKRKNQIVLNNFFFIDDKLMFDKEILDLHREILLLR
jgi:hypothetical protein